MVFPFPAERVICSLYLGGRYSPDLVVVGAHEEVGNTNAHHADNPLIEVLGLGVGHASLQSGIDHAVNAPDLLLLGKHGDVVLERVGNPFALATNVGDTLVGVPIVILGESLVNAVVEVFVVGENNVATDVVQLPRMSVHVSILVGVVNRRPRSTYEALRGHVGGGKATGCLVGVNDQPRRAILSNWLAGRVPFGIPLHGHP